MEKSIFNSNYLYNPLIVLVQKRSAQTNIPCAAGTSQEASIFARAADILSDNSIPFSLRALIEILMSSGCRISQALNIHSSQISATGRILIKGLKNGNDTTIQISIFKSFILSYRSANCYLFADYNRFFIYRFLKKNNISFQFSNSQKHAVTHFFRHYLAIDIHSLSKDENLIANSLGHKSLKSQKYYTHEK